MTTDKPRSVAPYIGLGVLAAAVALTGVGVAASGAADPSHPGSLRVADTAPTAVASDQPFTGSSAQPGTAQPTATPEPGTTTGAAGATPDTSGATPGATSSATATSAQPGATASSKPRATATAEKSTAKTTAKTTAKPSPKATASGAASSGVAAPAPAPGAAVAGAVPGNYAETSMGTATYLGNSMPVNGTPTLVVSTAAGQTQTQTVNDGNNSEVEKLVFGTGRIDATEISISSQIIDADFVLSPQEPIVELTPGATWSWKADSTDGKEHLVLTGSYAGTEQVTIDGKGETASIIKSTLTLTGSISGTITQTDDYDPTYKLVLREHSITKGTYMGVAVTLDDTTTLNSLKPS